MNVKSFKWPTFENLPEGSVFVDSDILYRKIGHFGVAVDRNGESFQPHPNKEIIQLVSIPFPGLYDESKRTSKFP